MLATCLGLGYLRPAPGTIGAAVGVLLYWAWLEPLSPMLQLAVVAAVTVVGIGAATSVCRSANAEDPSQVIIDEVAGMLMSLVAVHGSAGLAVAFLAFRVFDIVKPWPAGAAEALPEGWGVMADDVVAGVYALGTTHAILLLWS